MLQPVFYWDDGSNQPGLEMSQPQSRLMVAYFGLINPILIVKPLADENIAAAQYWMGYFHETGTGGTTGKNEKSAREWYSKAGKQGHMNAAHAAIRLLPLKNYDRIALLIIVSRQ